MENTTFQNLCTACGTGNPDFRFSNVADVPKERLEEFERCDAPRLVYGESGFAQGYAQENDFVYVDMERIREEGNLVW